MKLPEHFNYMLGMHTGEDMQWMLDLCEQHAPSEGIAVNLGVFHGKSTMILCEALGESRVFGIDNWKGGRRWGGSSVEQATEACERYGYKPKLLSGESTETFDLTNVAVLFVDTKHKASQVNAELDSWMPLLRPDALVMFHDYGEGVKDWVKPEEIESFRDYSRAIDERMSDWRNLGTSHLTVGFVR